MSIELRTFASGDTDYISKMNQNVSLITAAIEALQAQAGAAGGPGGGGLTEGVFLLALFNNADALIGPSSYKPSLSGTTATIAPGGMYIALSQTIVMSLNNVPLNFTGQSSGTKYINVGSTGIPTIQTSISAGTAYSIVWTGSAFSGVPVRIAPAFYDTLEADASRESTALDNSYQTLDHRLEASELIALSAKNDAENAIDIANEAKNMVSNTLVTVERYRKVGLTTDATTGIKGAIQLDFEGTIVGWSVIADVAGTLTVEISKKTSSPPPAAPAIPGVVTDKISASAPIALSSAQSAASAASGVATWTKTIAMWDVLQFNVTAASTFTRATLYVRIKEDPASASITTGPIASTIVANAPFTVANV